mgnify:FL=1
MENMLFVKKRYLHWLKIVPKSYKFVWRPSKLKEEFPGYIYNKLFERFLDIQLVKSTLAYKQRHKQMCIEMPYK